MRRDQRDPVLSAGCTQAGPVPAWRLGGRWAGLALLAAAAVAATSCGGGGGSGDPTSTMALVDFVFVDRDLRPTAPTGSLDLPRNAQIRFTFNQAVEAASVTVQTIRLRTGPQQSDVPEARFTVSGSVVVLDPTFALNGQPHPFGLEPAAQYVLDVLAFDPSGALPSVRSTSGDPNLVPLHTTFVTASRWLFESTPPRFLGLAFEPDLDPATGAVPGQGRVGLRFSEVMDPSLFITGPPSLPLPPGTTVDVRYVAGDPVNAAGGLASQAVAGVIEPDPSGTVFWFEPTFSLGDAPYRFTVQILQGLLDLSGNPLRETAYLGPFLTDGRGAPPGRILVEQFLVPDDLDPVASEADWGGSEPGVLRGLPMTTREARLYAYRQAWSGVDSGVGQYAPLAAPLVGRALNDVIPSNQIVPPTAAGRRVLLAVPEFVMGERGTITSAAWGPDSNATFASYHRSLVLRMGHQADGSLSLRAQFAANYAHGAAAIVYAGPLTIHQRANVGNVPGEPKTPHVGGYREIGACLVGGWNRPLFDFTGFQPFPALTTYFEWDPGAPGVGDQAFLFDVSATEGDSWQQMRGWAATAFPCSAALTPGFGARRLFSVYEGDDPVPPPLLGQPNPEPSLYDVAFTITRRVSIAQSRFYGPEDAASQALGGSTFGALSDYLPLQVTPPIQQQGARVSAAYQAAGQVSADRRTIDVAAPFTPWTANVDACDGLPWIRWRLVLESNLISGSVPRVDRVVLPIQRLTR